jgi:hypothetical protein
MLSCNNLYKYHIIAVTVVVRCVVSMFSFSRVLLVTNFHIFLVCVGLLDSRQSLHVSDITLQGAILQLPPCAIVHPAKGMPASLGVI